MAFVNEPTTGVTFEFFDSGGRKGTSSYWHTGLVLDPLNADIAALKNAIDNLTAAYLTGVQLTARASQDAAVTPTSGAYDRVQDKAYFEFVGSDGSVMKINLPTLKPGILEANLNNIDLANGDVAAFVTAMTTDAKTGEGTALVSVRNAYRRRPPRLKKQ